MLTIYPALPSTQDAAHHLASQGAPHGTAVLARVQTAGRGTRGKTWVSPEGGLWLSVVCRPAGGAAPEVASLRAGLALAEYLDTLLTPPAHVALKWPNDLMLGAGKVGGVLAEARWQGDRLSWIVVGVGLNLHNPVPKDVSPRAARLADAGVTESADDLADPVARAVARAVETGEPLSPRELEVFAVRDWLRGRALSQPEQGIASGISPAGRLRIRRSDGRTVEVDGPVTL